MAEDKDFAQRRLAEATKDVPRGVYAHRKGGEYVLYSFSVHEASLRPMGHYYSLTKKTRWSREIEVWLEEVDGKPRFWFLREATRQEMLEAADIPSDGP